MFAIFSYLFSLINVPNQFLQLMIFFIWLSATIIFVLSAWVSCYYYGMLEKKGEKVFFQAGLIILFSGLFPGAIAFLLGKIMA